MLTRPLDLASKLRPEPRSFDWLFLVNGGLIVLFFSLFHSQYVLTPGVDIRLPQVSGANDAGRPSTHYLTVSSTGMISVREGGLTFEQLREWLKKEAKTVRPPERPSLRVYADENVSVLTMTRIQNAAVEAGFVEFKLAAVEPPPAPVPGAR